MVESDSMRQGMPTQVEYGPRERFWLWVLAGFGFVVLNGVFLHGLFNPEMLREAMTNPLALVFIGEALVLVGVIGYLLAKWQVSRLSWRWFVFLSLLGSMAFALPVVLLWPKKRAENTRP